jgi:hypothetical protein
LDYKNTSIAKNHKTTTALVAIAALAAVLVGSTVAIGSAHIALADTTTTTPIKHFTTSTATRAIN